MARNWSTPIHMYQQWAPLRSQERLRMMIDYLYCNIRDWKVHEITKERHIPTSTKFVWRKFMITWQSAANGPTPSPVTHVKRDPVVLIYQQSSLQKYQKHTVDVDIDNLSLFKVASNFNDVCRAGFCRNLNFVSVGASDIARLYSDSVAGFARGCT